MGTKIHNWSIGYQILRYYVRFIHWIFYKKILVKGLEHLPINKPLILALNHQNAIMDALAVGCTISSQPVFLARADSFQNKLIAHLLKWLKIMPIYRQRDGFENLKKNEIIFNDVFEIIKAKGTIALMPEGTHYGRYRLQPLMKGIFRMVFDFQEKYIEYASPLIIPVGIHYSNYFSFRAKLFVQFGKPIDPKEYFEQYQDNKARAINNLKQKLTDELKSLIVNIECAEYYDDINFIRQLLRPSFARLNHLSLNVPWSEFLTDKIFTEKCNTFFNSNNQKFTEFAKMSAGLKEQLRLNKISSEHINLSEDNWLKISILIFGLILFSPFVIVGLIIYWLFRKLAQKINSKIEDTQFYSTTKYSVLLLAVPVIIILFPIIIAMLNSNESIKFLIFFGIIFSVVVSQWYVKLFFKTINSWRLLKVKRKNDFIFELEKEIIQMTYELFKN